MDERMIYHVTWANRKQFIEGTALGRLYGQYLVANGCKPEDAELLNGVRKVRWDDVPPEGGVEHRIRDKERSDTFIFILADYQTSMGSQVVDFDAWIEKEKLQDYIAYRVPYMVTNPGHPSNGRRLQIVVMQTKNHFQKELIK